MAPQNATTDPTDETRSEEHTAEQQSDWTPLANPRRVRI
ncbi:hypothetical protein SAMN06264364_106109 [Quadrisphaera granulorum]|uniref:Uncharacterized protein n=1 Tax=Quadrisphaera granulorum TaxID=317664 RepID=A0A316A9S3_9ACTN|nr:hypothetical protein BXY45_106109 [Quadrisphaera granulorum]SZE96028.1 hypothetical protein SAMN06264364_106109 [Quadrisphaera granulorum]